jgi:hypothetical protein
MRNRSGNRRSWLLVVLVTSCGVVRPAAPTPGTATVSAAAVEAQPAPSPTADAHPSPIVETTSPVLTPPGDQPQAVFPEQPHASAAPASLPGASVTDFRGAESISLAAAPDGSIYALLGFAGNLFVSRSDDGGQTFGAPVLASVSAPATVLSIERPALAVGEGGQVGVAWLEVLGSSHARVWYAHSADGAASFGPSVRVEETRGFETAMVRAALDSDQDPRLVWLDSSKLFYAASTDTGQTFEPARTLDDAVCECCQPHPVVIGEQVWIAYRNLEHDGEGRTIRDIFVLRSLDGGQTFDAPSRVGDGHWYLNACPIAGPALAAHGDRLYVAWMDGRDEVDGTGGTVDIWLAASSDLGQTFSANVRVNPTRGHFNTLPVLGVDPAGRIHLSWEADEAQRTVVYYSVSSDAGQTFSMPLVVADSTSGSSRGRPGKPALAVTGSGRIALAWLDRQGVQVAVWASGG